MQTARRKRTDVDDRLDPGVANEPGEFVGTGRTVSESERYSTVLKILTRRLGSSPVLRDCKR